MKERAKDRSSSKKKSATPKKEKKKNKLSAQKGATAGKSFAGKSVGKNATPRSPKSPGMARTLAHMAALAEVDALLGKPGASAGGRPKPAPTFRTEAVPAPAKAPPLDPSPEGEKASRFERCLIRAQKGEPGPIRLGDLTLDPAMAKATAETGQIQTYKRILEATPQAQPGRPLVNIVGSSDADLRFDLISLYELVMAAQELGRDQLQVSLVRLTEDEATALRAKPPEVPSPQENKVLSPTDVAKMNGFLEVSIQDIYRDENLRQRINDESAEFRNLMESIRTIGLQNPPVLEVRSDGEDNQKLVCVSGHRRLLAMERLGVTKVTCALKLFESEKHRALAGLAENINREDLHFLDKADGYGLLAQQGMSGSEIAALLDTDSRTVGKYLRASAWDPTVKQRIRDLGSKATTRFLLNALAAGERSTTEIHAMIDRFLESFSSPSAKSKPPKGAELQRKLGEFCTLAGYGDGERALIEKALRYLGYLG